jgi:hypothetical protein
MVHPNIIINQFRGIAVREHLLGNKEGKHLYDDTDESSMFRLCFDNAMQLRLTRNLDKKQQDAFWHFLDSLWKRKEPVTFSFVYHRFLALAKGHGFPKNPQDPFRLSPASRIFTCFRTDFPDWDIAIAGKLIGNHGFSGKNGEELYARLVERYWEFEGKRMGPNGESVADLLVSFGRRLIASYHTVYPDEEEPPIPQDKLISLALCQYRHLPLLYREESGMTILLEEINRYVFQEACACPEPFPFRKLVPETTSLTEAAARLSLRDPRYPLWDGAFCGLLGIPSYAALLGRIWQWEGSPTEKAILSLAKDLHGEKLPHRVFLIQVLSHWKEIPSALKDAPEKKETWWRIRREVFPLSVIESDPAPL